MSQQSIADNLIVLRQQIRQSELNAKRPAGSTSLLAVSKKKSVEDITAAFMAGQKKFGESYLQEALEKKNQLKELPIEWHFIGSIQSNKAKLIAQNFDWVHSVSRLSVAKRLNTYRCKDKPPLNICIEVNIDNELSKTGLNATEIVDLAHEITLLPDLKLRGLMAIPQKEQDPTKQLTAFKKIAALQNTLIQKGFLLDTLSMGMTTDFPMAIIAGSTIVRVGTAIFGKR